jgi:transposase
MGNMTAVIVLSYAQVARHARCRIAKIIDALRLQIRKIEIAPLAWHRTSGVSQRLETIPAVDFITATAALAATVGDAGSGGKERLGGIAKMGDRYLRHLLVVGATAIVRYTKRRATAVSAWTRGLLERQPARLVTVAVANKMARIAWAIMARQEVYRAARAVA